MRGGAETAPVKVPLPRKRLHTRSHVRGPRVESGGARSAALGSVSMGYLLIMVFLKG